VNLCDALTDDELRVLMRWVCDHQVSLLAAVRWFVVSGLTPGGGRRAGRFACRCLHRGVRRNRVTAMVKIVCGRCAEGVTT
jgi:hypothetical protein